MTGRTIGMATNDADRELVERLLDGDEAAFESLIDTHHRGMVKLARTFVVDETAAEEVVQETWTAVIDGLERFEGRSSLKTWIFSILTNLARKRGEKDSRSVAWSSLSDEPLDGEVDEDSNRFNTEGRWSVPPVPWNTDPEEELLRTDMLEKIQQAIETLPPSQGAVVRLRDVEGLPSEEVCELLDISSGNQRVLLHRGRSKVRDALESYLKVDEGSP